MTGLRGAVALLTRVPVGHPPASLDAAAVVAFMPVVGALIGLAISGVYVAATAAVPKLPAAAIAIAVGVVGTGALHEDGLADMADAFGGRDRADALRILKDPRHGTYGVLALVLSVLLRVVAVATLTRSAALVMLPVAHALSRATSVAVLASGPPLTADGLGATYALSARAWPLTVAGVTVTVMTVFLVGPWAGVALAMSAAIAAAVRQSAVRRLRGVNGDVAGASQQLCEMTLLMLASAHAPAPLFS